MESPHTSKPDQSDPFAPSSRFQGRLQQVDSSSNTNSLKSVTIETELPFNWRSGKPKSGHAKGLVILLHGYQDHGGYLFRKLFPQGWPAEELAWLAPNGPFPTPVKTEKGWKEAYAWYFFDPDLNKLILPPNTALRGIQAAIAQEGFASLPKLVFGFSQGGWLAPYVAQNLTEVRGIMALGAGIREEYYPHPPASWPVDFMHGTDDHIVDRQQAQTLHAKLIARGYSGRYELIPGLDHRGREDVGLKLVSRARELLLPSQTGA
ncbi:MAG TPA: dienelactone hydrolase family protein [Pseudobdellovibrionaceae bacterium]|nr:dienelactone hydrolase family protein [Pseudobdellovibrionaceae bacterium]